ncbi:hypothetical protein JR316_0004112 [Psilocybe cubensis]|uniref:Uncharacterized protein n=1 Tax=Psilocybe cubensis TaxID=181762 RepID=A0ACB8H9E2_PSICU|nr:hypothetical protein JR316_0004112 [Psilocybe cubensis]KAH9484630.1 hypothetical protein JR316_0004112 [Psilocybe cubensis]
MSSRTRKKFRAATFHCSYSGCLKTSTTSWGIQQHYDRKHVTPAALDVQSALLHAQSFLPQLPSSRSPSPSPQPWSNNFSPRRSPRQTPSGSPKSNPSGPNPVPTSHIDTHPTIDGRPCDSAGHYLPPNTKPQPAAPHNKEDFTPFATRTEFEMAEFLFVEEEMSAGRIDRLSQILGANYPDQDPPFANHSDMYACIDSIKQGNIPWTSFSVTYNGKLPKDGPIPEWMTQKYEVWFRNPLDVLEQQIGNPTYVGNIDYAPKRYYWNGKRRYRNLMSGQWAWLQANKIAQDIKCHGSMFCPVIIGSDKTTVSVATGQNDFYPLYMSLGNIHNKMRRAHKNAVSLVGFLAIPKTSQEYSDRADFRKFRRQLFHTSLEHILSSLRPYMSTPRVTMCGDGHYRRIIYGIGPYIADYPEQALLACIVQGWCPRQPFTSSFPRADIHELLAPDLLHQIIKGTFKDHLVDWVTQYINQHHDPPIAKKILADIDRRIVLAPSFPGLQHFHQGRGFKQWTGDDSKGLMKVYLPAIAGHVPDQMVQAVAAFLDFCYLVRRNAIDDDTLDQIEVALSRFHCHREIFRDLNVRPEGFSLPRQHSLAHYPMLIRLFGAPNGLCSSITENKHIKAVKKPYRRSSRYKALGQMLVTNQRVEKLLAARVFFTEHNMLNGISGPHIPVTILKDTPPEPPRRASTEECGEVFEPESQSEITLAKSHVRGVPLAIEAHQ